MRTNSAWVDVRECPVYEPSSRFSSSAILDQFNVSD